MKTENLSYEEIKILMILGYDTNNINYWLENKKLLKEDVQLIIGAYKDYLAEIKKLDDYFKNYLRSLNEKLLEKINTKILPPAQKGDIFHTQKYGKIMVTRVASECEELQFCNEDGNLKTLKFEEFQKLEMIK